MTAMVSLADTFPVVAAGFISFIKQIADEKGGVSEIILLGHNAKVFDIPWLFHQLTVHGMLNQLFDDRRINYGMDTLTIVKTAIKNDRTVGAPTGYSLPVLYQFVTGDLPDTSHRAMADVMATAAVFRFFWDAREECFFFIGERGPYHPPSICPNVLVENDSDDSDSGLEASHQAWEEVVVVQTKTLRRKLTPRMNLCLCLFLFLMKKQQQLLFLSATNGKKIVIIHQPNRIRWKGSRTTSRPLPVIDGAKQVYNAAHLMSIHQLGHGDRYSPTLFWKKL
jgi:Exonuclease